MYEYVIIMIIILCAWVSVSASTSFHGRLSSSTDSFRRMPHPISYPGAKVTMRPTMRYVCVSMSIYAMPCHATLLYIYIYIFDT